MSKKHFLKAAELVKAYPGDTRDSKLIKLHVAENFCRLFKFASPKFDETRFMTACGF